MTALLTPRRRRGTEYLDDPAVDGRVARRSLADVACANALFGGTRAVMAEIDIAIAQLGAHGSRRVITLLDVGTGMGDIPARARELAARSGVELRTVGVDMCEALVRAARSTEFAAARADALALPFADSSVDIVMCSQLLHHFDRDGGLELLRELDRVARLRVIVSDLRRSWLAAAGIWLASFPLGFHPVSRHDGVVSVLRGFTRHELRTMVSAALERQPVVHDRLGFRTTAAWTPTVARVE